MPKRNRRRSPLLWWDLAGAAVAVTVTVLYAVDRSTDEGWRLPITSNDIQFLLTMLVAAALYVTLGRASVRRSLRGEQLVPTDIVFIVVFAAVTGFGVLLWPSFATLQVIGYPLAWTVMRTYRQAVIANLTLAFAVFLGLWGAYVRLGVDAPLRDAGFIAGVSLAFSLAMGTWITRISDQGERYRALAEQLQASQDEVAELSTLAGAAEERNRLSRELHDTLTQTLTGLTMLAEQSRRSLESGNVTQALGQTGRIEEAARYALGEARALVATNWPLGEGSLGQSLERIVTRLRDDTGLTVHLRIDPDAVANLDREIEVVLLRAAQEGLANARKHAQASSVWLTIEATPDVTVLTVEDDGTGLPEHPTRNGFGLTGMRDRVRLVSGEVDVGPSPHGGAKFEVRIPRARAAGRAEHPAAERAGDSE